MQADKIENMPEIFLFINSGSGGGVGKELLESPVLNHLIQTKKLTFSVPRSQKLVDADKLISVNVFLFNLRDE